MLWSALSWVEVLKFNNPLVAGERGFASASLCARPAASPFPPRGAGRASLEFQRGKNNRSRGLLELLPKLPTSFFAQRCAPRSSLARVPGATPVPGSTRIGATPRSRRTSRDGFSHAVKRSRADPDHRREPRTRYSQVSSGLHRQCRLRSHLPGEHPEAPASAGRWKTLQVYPRSRNHSRNRTGKTKDIGEPGTRSVRPRNRQSLRHFRHDITQPVHNPSAAAPDHLGGAAGRSGRDLILVLLLSSL